MNFPLDQLFSEVYRNQPFKDLAWADWVTKGETQLFGNYIRQQGGTKVPEEFFEQQGYYEEEITGAFMRSLERFRFPSNDTLDRHIRHLFRIWDWFASFEADCFQGLAKDQQAQLAYFHNPSTTDYSIPLDRVAKNLHAAFPHTLSEAPKEFRTMEDCKDAYDAVALNELKIPPRRSSSISMEHHKYDPRLARILMGTRDGLNEDALVPHLVRQIQIAVEMFHNLGDVGDQTSFDSLVTSFEKEFGAAHFHVTQFLDAFPPVDRLKYNRTQSSAPEPTRVSAADYSSLFYTDTAYYLRQSEEANRLLTKLFMLSGYRYDHFMQDPVEEFGRVCAKHPTPRNINVFEHIMDTFASNDLGIFKFTHFEPVDIQLRCLKYIVSKSNTIAQDPAEKVSTSSWGAPQKVTPQAAREVPTPRGQTLGQAPVQWPRPDSRRPGVTGYPAEVEAIKAAVETPTNATILWVLGGVCLGAFVLAR